MPLYGCDAAWACLGNSCGTCSSRATWHRIWEPSEHKVEIDTVNTSLCSKKSLKLLLSKILSPVLGVEDASILETALHSTVCED